MDHRDEAIDGLGQREGGVGLGPGAAGEGEGDGSEAAEQGAKENAGVAVGDGAGAVLKESAEDEEDRGRNLGAIEAGQSAAEVEPAAERGGAVAEGGNTGLGRMLATEDVGGGGAQAAVLPVGIDEAALHGTSWRKLVAGSQKLIFAESHICQRKADMGHPAPGIGDWAKEKAASVAAFFIYYPLLSEYQVQGISAPTFLAVSGTISREL